MSCCEAFGVLLALYSSVFMCSKDIRLSSSATSSDCLGPQKCSCRQRESTATSKKERQAAIPIKAIYFFYESTHACFGSLPHRSKHCFMWQRHTIFFICEREKDYDNSEWRWRCSECEENHQQEFDILEISRKLIDPFIFIIKTRATRAVKKKHNRKTRARNEWKEWKKHIFIYKLFMLYLLLCIYILWFSHSFFEWSCFFHRMSEEGGIKTRLILLRLSSSRQCVLSEKKERRRTARKIRDGKRKSTKLIFPPACSSSSGLWQV